MQLHYKADFLDLLAKLAIINNEMVIRYEDGYAIVRHGTRVRNPLVYVRAWGDFFSIPDGECIAFHDYTQFYNKFRAMEYPELSLEKGRIVMTSDGRTATHNLANPALIPDVFMGQKNANLPSVEASTIFEDQFIRKMCNLAGANLFDANRVLFHFGENDSYYQLHSTLHTNTYKEPLNIGKFYSSDEQFSMDFDMALFAMLPIGYSYNVAICKGGAMELDMFGTNGISCTLYLSRIA